MVRVAATLVLLLLAGTASGDTGGLVYADANANGVRDEGEAPRPGIAVSNGLDVVVTGADGRYRLPEAGAGFVMLTCPADGHCPVWYRRGAGDFGVVPRPVPPDFFFIQVSDAHVYTRVEDFASLVRKNFPSWLPRNLLGWLVLRGLDRNYADVSRGEIVEHLRAAMGERGPAADAWDSTVMIDYMELAMDPESGLVTPSIDVPRAFAEVAALEPAFVVNTGDLVLEGNDGAPEAVERWYDYYLEVAEASGLEIYETIGNNELAGTHNADFPSSDPRYGRGLYRSHFGPSHYSFDRGAFHFVAVDTHARNPAGRWSFYRMEPGVRDWLDADLAASRGRTLVVLNHEPFHYDPSWEFEDPKVADDEGLLARHGVAYSLAGHTHKNGFQDAPESGGTTYITTGALSGFRWSLPTGFDPRGYRLFYARGERLYSAWKQLGRPVLGFVDPARDDGHHPASTRPARPDALRGTVSVVAVAADVDGPFERLELHLSGTPLATVRWGDYFVHARLDADALDGSSVLELRATNRDGELHRRKLAVARAAPGAED